MTPPEVLNQVIASIQNDYGFDLLEGPNFNPDTVKWTAAVGQLPQSPDGDTLIVLLTWEGADPDKVLANGFDWHKEGHSVIDGILERA